VWGAPATVKSAVIVRFWIARGSVFTIRIFGASATAIASDAIPVASVGASADAQAVKSEAVTSQGQPIFDM
jgi:hypothetical protein